MLSFVSLNKLLSTHLRCQRFETQYGSCYITVIHYPHDIMRLDFQNCHDDVIKWKHFPRYWPFVQGIHRAPVNSPHNGQWRGALMFSLISVWINDWVNNFEAGDLRCNHGHYDVNVMSCCLPNNWYHMIWYGITDTCLHKLIETLTLISLCWGQNINSLWCHMPT